MSIFPYQQIIKRKNQDKPQGLTFQSSDRISSSKNDFLLYFSALCSIFSKIDLRFSMISLTFLRTCFLDKLGKSSPYCNRSQIYKEKSTSKINFSSAFVHLGLLLSLSVDFLRAVICSNYQMILNIVLSDELDDIISNDMVMIIDCIINNRFVPDQSLLIMIIYNHMLFNTIAYIISPSRQPNTFFRTASYLFCQTKNQTVNKKTESKKIPIQSLTQLFRQSNSIEELNFDKQDLQPSQLFLLILRGLKKNLHQHAQKQQKMLKLLNKYKENKQYIKKYLYFIVPTDQLFPKMNQLYRQVTLKYLKSGAKLSKEQLYYVLENLQRIMTEVRSEWSDENWIIRDYTEEQQIVNLLIPQFIAAQQQFNISIFIKLTQICNSLGAYNPELAAFLLNNIDSDSCRIKLREYMSVLSYLSEMNSFPHQYFYKNKLRWIGTIESYNKFSSKKSYESIKMLQLLVAQNPMFCERIIKKTQDILLEAMPSFDPQEQANLWFLCCKAKFGIYPEIIKKLLQKISGTLSEMKMLDLCLIVRGFQRFMLIGNYREITKTILTQISLILDPRRVYEHQIIKYMLNNTLADQRLSHQSLI